MRGKSTWIALAVIGLILLIILLNSVFPGTLDGEDAKLDLTYSLVLLVMVGSSVMLGQRGNATTALKQAVAWLGIFATVIVLYSYRLEFQHLGARLTGELVPTRPTISGDGVVTLHRGQGGHFVVDGQVNGKTIRFMVDTGASDVALSVENSPDGLVLKFFLRNGSAIPTTVFPSAPIAPRCPCP